MVHNLTAIPSTIPEAEVAFLAQALAPAGMAPFSAVYAEVDALARRGGRPGERTELLAAVAEAKRRGEYPPAYRALLLHLGGGTPAGPPGGLPS